jgi:hypothetical protein
MFSHETPRLTWSSRHVCSAELLSVHGQAIFYASAGYQAAEKGTILGGHCFLKGRKLRCAYNTLLSASQYLPLRWHGYSGSSQWQSKGPISHFPAWISRQLNVGHEIKMHFAEMIWEVTEPSTSKQC